MIMMVREQEIRAQGREEGRAQGREEGRREQALATFNRLLALNIPEAQARAGLWRRKRIRATSHSPRRSAREGRRYENMRRHGEIRFPPGEQLKKIF